MLNRWTVFLVFVTASWFLASGLAFGSDALSATVDLLTDQTAPWTAVGKGVLRSENGSLVVQDCLAVAGDPSWKDYELRFQGRAPADASEAQVWCAVRCFDRDRRYIVGVRGGNNQQLYIERRCAGGDDRFLGRRALNFNFAPGDWVTVRVQIAGSKIAVYLRDDAKPFLAVNDVATKTWSGPSFSSGQIALGGGYLPAEYRTVSVKPIDASAVPGSTPLDAPADDDAQRRQAMRAAYQPAVLRDTHEQSLSLNGNWLFLPDYACEAKVNYADPALDDAAWHVMNVPDFWTPTRNWLFGEQSRYTGPFMGDKGQSDNWWDLQQARCNAYTFDWKKTNAAWYRHHLVLPGDLADQRYELQFDGVAKQADVYVNGKKAASNLGMFRELRVDATALLHGGENVIAIYVSSGEKHDTAADNEVADVAVTVEITKKMLNSLPAGMYRGTVAGIWQPVTLNVSRKVFVGDLYFQPRLNGAKIDVAVTNSSATDFNGDVAARFDGTGSQPTLATPFARAAVSLKAGDTKTITLDTGNISPALWTPDTPNLYRMKVSLDAGGQPVSTKQIDVGFRTFEVSGKRFLLNGQPYWLRGADHTPMPEQPNDAALADRFLQLMHDSNIRVTRSHGAPFNETWLDAADRIGVGVSYEGIWPWLMLKGGMPQPWLLADWHDEWLSLLRKYRNHPSILFWTVNNEMHLSRTKDPDLLIKKWSIVSDAIHDMRQLDPSRPVCADSGYTRSEELPTYQKVIQPRHLDDGDIDDLHEYPGWYGPSFYQYFAFPSAYRGDHFRDESRPKISQELSTGYPRTDDGLPTRVYTLDNLTPQALVGDNAYETSDPSIFLNRIAITTQMLGEAIRRLRQPSDAMAGALQFSLVTWCRNAFDAKRLEPTAPLDGLKRALQPVLVCAEMRGWNYFAGDAITLPVAVINDREPAGPLPATRLEWSVQAGDQTLSSGSTGIDAIPYYGIASKPVTIALPAKLSSPRVRATLHLNLLDGQRLVSSNEYPILLASRAWSGAGQTPAGVRRFDPAGKLSEVCQSMGWTLPTAAKAQDLFADPKRPAVIASFGWVADPAQHAAFDSYIENGGNALLYQPGDALLKLASDKIAAYRSDDIEIATAHVTESPIVSEIEPNEIAWFTRTDVGTPIATHGDFQLANPLDSTSVIVQDMPFHGYLSEAERHTMQGATVFPIHRGLGTIWVTQLAHEYATHDPVAARVLHQLLLQLDAGR